MNYPERPMKAVAQQNGSVLLVSLVLMAVITLLGLSAMKTALTAEKITGHIQDSHLADEAAESALRDGQRTLRRIASQITTPELHRTITQPGAEDAPDKPTYPPSLTDWTQREIVVDANRLRTPDNDNSETHVPQPVFKLELFNEELPELTTGSSDPAEQIKQRGTSFYRVFARGVGRSGENQVILQSMLIEDLAPGF